MGQKRHSHDAARRRRRLRPGRGPDARAAQQASQPEEAVTEAVPEDVVTEEVVTAPPPVAEAPKPTEPVPAPPPSPSPPQPARPPARRPRSGGAPAPAPIREATGGLRGLVGAGPTQLPPAIAMRARDASRPTDDDIATAERDLVIVRRHWTPPENS
ncbi:hypothetical protein [Fodinicola acaciae]|uniref:hypothetical protein n=1 Tax=Fodinicola acaciae TaxID=2681555 RepID=UPI001C9E4297|nr:hypothetical protein [Fodinicola acaciae]